MPLATIQKIKNIYPIENADNIECAEILGWKIVVRKGEFKVDDLCIYIEIDSLIPRKSWSEFLFKHSKETKYRLRTVKLRGQISQGLVIPCDILGSFDDCGSEYPRELETDLTEFLEIEKYEKQIPDYLQGIYKSSFPVFIPKTDEVRIQSNPKLLEELKGKPYYITTKMDGTSATFYKKGETFGVCSRNLELEESDDSIYWKIAKRYNIKSWLKEGYAIQGEICGPGIQNNPVGLKDLTLFVFTVFDIYNYKPIFHPDWLPQDYNFTFVPIEEIGESFDYTMEDLLLKAQGTYPSGVRKEGIVVRSLDQKISFKVLNNDYLLKDEE